MGADGPRAVVLSLRAAEGPGLVVRCEQETGTGVTSFDEPIERWSTDADAPWWQREPCTDAWWSEVFDRVDRWSGGDERRSDRDALAAALSRVLLPRKVNDRVVELRSELATGDRLTVAIEFNAGLDERLARLPWELVQLQAEVPLQGPRVSMVRLVARRDGSAPDAQDVEPTGHGGLATLIAVGPRRVPGSGWAPPTGADATLQRELGHLEGADLGTPLVPVSLGGLDRALARFSTGDPLDLMVFDGHGEQDGLWFAGEAGTTAVTIAAEQLAELVSSRVRAVVLVACRAGSSPVVRDSWAGVAEALARVGVATIGFTTPVGATSAAEFVRALVAGLRSGRSLDAAATDARQVLGGDGAAHARVAVWQASTTPVLLRAPAASAPTGPPLEVSQDRYGGQAWFQPRPGLEADLATAIETGARIIEVLGPPGAGKSSLLRWWFSSPGRTTLPTPSCALLRDPVLVHRDPLAGDVLCARIATAAARRTGRGSEAADAVTQMRLADDAAVWRKVTLAELHQVERAGHAEPLLVLVDELDQADDTFVRFLAEAISTAPPWVRWILVSRPDMPTLPGVRAPEATAIVSLAKHPDEDATTGYAHRLLAPLLERDRLGEAARRRLAATIGERAHGVFLWVRAVCDLLIAQADNTPLAAGPDVIEGLRLPAAASGNAMAVLFDEAIRPAAARDLRVATILGAIAACRDPQGLTSGQLAALTSLPTTSIDAICTSRAVRPFLDRRGDRWQPFHQSLTDWIRTDLLGASGTGEGEAGIGLALDELLHEERLGDLRNYATSHLSTHLTAGLKLLGDHHVTRPRLVKALTRLFRDDGWLLDAALALGPAAVAADLQRSRRWVDGKALGERHEVFVQATRAVAAANFSEADLLSCLHTEAKAWEEVGLAAKATERLDGEGPVRWRLCWRRGPRHRVGTAVCTDHSGWVNAVAWSPDGTRLATASHDGTARIWNPDTGQPTTEPLTHNDTVWAVAWSPDGTRLATASNDRTVRIWNPDTGQPTTEPLTHTNWVTKVSWSPDGTRLATASNDHAVRIWNPNTGQPTIRPLTHDDTVTAIAWNHDGTRLATASTDHTTIIWNPDTGQPAIAPLNHTDRVWALAWNHDGTRLATAGDDHTARIWNPNTGQPTIRPLTHDDTVSAIAWNHDGTRLATASDSGTARIWNPDTGEPATGPLTHANRVCAVAWNLEGTRLATASWDATTCVWDPTTGEPASGSLTHTDKVSALAWSPDGARLATASHDKTARIWNPDNCQPATEPVPHIPAHTDTVTAVAWGRDSMRLATASDDGSARIWNPDTGQPSAGPLHHARRVQGVAWSPDGSRIATTGVYMDTAHVWDPNTGQPTIRPLTHDDTVTALAWNHDGTRIATASHDYTARIWNPNTGQPTTEPLTHTFWVTAVAWNHNGTRLATASHDHTARIWNPNTGQPTTEPLTHNDTVRAIAWSPDGTRLATVSSPRYVHIWDASTGQPTIEPLTLPGIQGKPGMAVAWSPDGARLATASGDRKVHIWNANTGQPTIEPLTHADTVTALAWNHDGTRIATGSGDHIARIWDPNTGQPSSLTHADAVTALAWNHDGTRLATGSKDGSLSVWGCS